jgi:hypothetical protein
MLYYAAAVLAASMVLGQAEAQDQKDDLQKFQSFVGTWESRGQENRRRYVSWTPVLQGRFFERLTMGIDTSGKITGWGLMMFGRDPSDGKVRGWEFHPTSGYGDTPWEMNRTTTELIGWEGKTSKWSTEFVWPDGNSFLALEDRFEWVDENTYKRVAVLEQSGRVEQVLTRVTLQSDFSLPQPITEMPAGVSEPMKELAWWVGQCTTEGTDAFTGKLAVGQSRCGWVMNGNFLRYDITAVDSDMNVGQYRAVIGVDPLTKQVTGWEFDSTGAVGKYIVTDKGQEIVGEATSSTAGLLKYKGRMTKTADGMEYRATGELPAGKTTSYYGIWKKRK